MRFFAAFWVFCWSLPAFAGVTLVPTAPLLADGATQATVRLYVDGTQYPKVKIKSDAGKVGPAVPAADGTVTFPFTPSRVASPGVAALTVNVAGVDTVVNVPVIPAFSGTLQVTFDPPVLSSTGSATVKITPSTGSPVSADRRRFLLSASLGTVDAPVPSGSGSWIARYTPPKGLTTPTMVVFSAADAAAPNDVTGWAALPVSVKRSVSFDGPTGSNALLEVGDRTYGPFPVAPTGKVAFDVETDPRYPKGSLTLVDAVGAKTVKDVDLPAVGATQLAFLTVTPAVPAAGSLRIRVLELAPGGREKTDGAVKLSVSGGTISEAKYTNGAWEAVFSATGSPGDVTVTAEADGAKATRTLKVLPGVGVVTLTSDPAEIAATGTSVKVTARVKDSTGKAMVGRAPGFVVVAGGTISGTPKDNGDGSYTVTVNVTKGANLLRVAAAPAVTASGAGPVRLVAWPSSSLVAANGTDQVVVNVVAVDPYGLPVPDVDLALGVPLGDGSIAPTAKIGANGVARVSYKAGNKPGLGSVRIEGAGLVTEIPVFQGSATVSAAVPPGGPPDMDALLARWQSASPELTIVRTGTAPLSGPPATVQLSTVPPYTTPGAAILVTVRVLDASGKGVPSQKLSITPSVGAAGAVTDNHDGTFVFPLQLPAGTDGPVTLTVGAGGISGSTTLPKLADAGAVAQSAPRTTGGGTSAPGSGRAPPPPSDQAKLRLGAGLLNPHGSFQQSGNGGSQLIGDASFATPGMGFVGVGGDVLYWPVNASFGAIGLDARANVTLQHFTALEKDFWNPAANVIAGAQYRRTKGALSFQGELGAHFLTGVLFRYADAALSEPKLLSFPKVGARLGAAGTLETGKSYATLELAETFVPFPVDTHASLFYEYDFQDNLGARLGVAWDLRSMKYATDDGEGEARMLENTLTANLGVGFTF